MKLQYARTQVVGVASKEYVEVPKVGCCWRSRCAAICLPQIFNAVGYAGDPPSRRQARLQVRIVQQHRRHLLRCSSATTPSRRARRSAEMQKAGSCRPDHHRHVREGIAVWAPWRRLPPKASTSSVGSCRSSPSLWASSSSPFGLSDSPSAVPRTKRLCPRSTAAIWTA